MWVGAEVSVGLRAESEAGYGSECPGSGVRHLWGRDLWVVAVGQTWELCGAGSCGAVIHRAGNCVDLGAVGLRSVRQGSIGLRSVGLGSMGLRPVGLGAAWVWDLWS